MNSCNETNKINGFIDPDLYDEIKAGTNIISGEDFKQMMYGVSQVASDLVVKTLGPFGQTTLLDDGTFTYPTKDGYNVINRLRFNDPVYNSLFKSIKDISFTIVTKVGDGTTTALVGANAFLKMLIDYQKTHTFRQAEFINEVEKIKNHIINELTTGNEIHRIDPDGDFSDIHRIARISSNDNIVLADMIQSIYKETRNPNIYVTLDNGNSVAAEIQTGYKFDCKVLNHKAYINDDNGTCVKKIPTYIAIFDHNVTYNEHGQFITMLSRYAGSLDRELIIIAPHFDDVITTIIGSTVNGFLQKNQIPNIMMMQVPLSMDIQRQYLSDVVLLTNSQVIDSGKVRACMVMVHNQSCPPDDKIDDEILNIEGYKFGSPEELISSCLGYTTNITIADKYAVIQDYEAIANPLMLKNTLDEARRVYEIAKEKAHKSATPLIKEYMDSYQRYTKLVGKMGVIKVGGISELEKHCTKDLVDDAVLACRSAYDNGYVCGLNLSLLRSIDNVMFKTSTGTIENLDMNIIEMFDHTFTEVSEAVMSNRYNNFEQRHVNGLEGKYNNFEILAACIENKLGYNLITNSVDHGPYYSVINSVSTDIEILNAIVSILTLMLTSNQFLSVNRGYDRKISKQQAIDIVSKEKGEIAKAMAKAILEIDPAVIENSPIIQKLFPSMSPASNYMWLNAETNLQNR